MTRKDDLNPRAAQALRGIVTLADKGKPTPDILKQIRSLAVDALEALNTPDPRVREMVMIVLAIQATTKIPKKVVFGVDRDLPPIVTDQGGYDWAMIRLHRLVMPQ